MHYQCLRGYHGTAIMACGAFMLPLALAVQRRSPTRTNFRGLAFTHIQPANASSILTHPQIYEILTTQPCKQTVTTVNLRGSLPATAHMVSPTCERPSSPRVRHVLSRNSPAQIRAPFLTRRGTLWQRGARDTQCVSCHAPCTAQPCVYTLVTSCHGTARHKTQTPTRSQVKTH